MQSTKYAVHQHLRPTIAPLSAAVSLALAATNLQAATITVDTLADGSVAGQCTLRDAFDAANADTTVAGCGAGSGADDIVFDAGLSGTLTLTSDLIEATSEISLAGPGPSDITISGSGAYRLFGVSTAQGSLSVSGLTLDDGYASSIYGGAAAAAISGSALSLSNCVISNNSASSGSYGGAVLAGDATLTIDNCEFSNNRINPIAALDAGDERGPILSAGGAVLAIQSPEVTISNSSFYANEAFLGGAIAISNCLDADVISSTISGNSADFGGGIAWLDGSLGSLVSSVVDANYALGGAGAAVL